MATKPKRRIGGSRKPTKRPLDTRVTLGPAFERWRALRAESELKTDADVALSLLDGMKRSPSSPASTEVSDKKIKLSQSEVEILIEQEVHTALKKKETKLQFLIETIKRLDRDIDYEGSMQKLQARVNAVAKRAEEANAYMTKTQKKSPLPSLVNGEITRADSEDETTDTRAPIGKKSMESMAKSGDVFKIMETTKQALKRMHADNEALKASMADLSEDRPPPVLTPYGSPKCKGLPRFIKKEPEENHITYETEENHITYETEENHITYETEENHITYETEENHITYETEENHITYETEENHITYETEEKRRTEEAEEKRRTEEAEEKRRTEEAEEKRRTEEAEEKRRTEEAEEKRRTEEAEEKRRTKQAEEKRRTKEAEEKRRTNEPEQKRRTREAEEKRRTNEPEQKHKKKEPEEKCRRKESPENKGKKKNVEESMKCEEPKVRVKEECLSPGESNNPKHTEQDTLFYPPLPPTTFPSILNMEAASYNIPQKPVVYLALVRSVGLSVHWKFEKEEPCAPPMDSYSVFMAVEKVKGSGVFRDWTNFGEVKALPLPMCAVISKYKPGRKVCVTVVGKDKFGRYGPYSNVVTKTIPE